MVRSIVASLLLGRSVCAFAQPQHGRGESAPDWNVSKYVWSHTHPVSAAGAKPVLDFQALDNWYGVGSDENVSISPDGKYFGYRTRFENGPQANQMDGGTRSDSLIVQSTSGTTWRWAFGGAGEHGFFSSDSKQYIFTTSEQICFLSIATGQSRCVSYVAFKRPDVRKNEWIAYQLPDPTGGVVLQHLPSGRTETYERVSGFDFDRTGRWFVAQRNDSSKSLELHQLLSGKRHRFTGVDAYAFSPTSNALLLKITAPNVQLDYVVLPSGARSNVWRASAPGVALGGYSMDSSGTQVALQIRHQGENEIWYWRLGLPAAVLRVNRQTPGIEAGYSVAGLPFFNEEGRYIRVTLQAAADTREPHPDAVKVDVWSYKDSIVQSSQLYRLKRERRPNQYEVLVASSGGLLLRDNSFERISHVVGDYVLVRKGNERALDDRFWQPGYATDSTWILSLKDGTRTFLQTVPHGELAGVFSHGGSYVIYFDAQQCHYFSYQLATGKRVNISRGIPGCDLRREVRYGQERSAVPWIPGSAGIAGWLPGDSGMLVYDNYDIWQLDLTGAKAPVNVTNGYGRKHRIKFMTGRNGENGQSDNANDWSAPTFAPKTALLLKTFHEDDKHSGVYRKVFSTRGDPEMLYHGPVVLDMLPVTADEQYLGWSQNVVKAADASAWIVKRQSPTDAPNYYLTKNFQTYTRLTDIAPHRGYNWLTAELHSFPQADGSKTQGVLFKPENFDSTKRYPVLVAFYFEFSPDLNKYLPAEYMYAPSAPAWNPAWMVSHDYLVFAPDIVFTRDYWGPGVLNTMDGAARYLRTLPYVDGQHLALAGHSNSGRMGYYVLTHSNEFAAMVIGSGFSGTNVIGHALSLDVQGEPSSNLRYGEAHFGNLWTNKEVWIDHTAVLQADKVTSPLLLTHNNKDQDDVLLAVQLFTALRRLDKKTWWLQYDEGNHILSKLSDLKDFTIRYTQFLDHYLKGAPPPTWMTQGIPATLKGVEARLDLDSSGQRP